ncbi:GNAT family N-acetyltransferase [Oleiagrimonas soli]|uniref:GCN5 family acetyltransferase n=1 Tax=Oleiagrimonas soli TaxID=1543381 RepID=A0A099CTA6_9GAMM|nr:GNAT family N-acetyltransferase [Oleiagrimonas soli]KGI76989.1 GCN5 family acetyltransferase [Oleiagrimonas soli]MBB6185503.1 ribosomal protein S18 acetylase RimI-like enzyme [Oleiagrimonas soli]
MSDSPFLIRLARPDDDDFIIGLVPRFVDFTLPAWRRRNECIEGIRKDLSEHLEDSPANSFMFVAEDRESGRRLGFVHLQKTQDFFNGRTNCHISDLAVSPKQEGRGIGRALLDHSREWAHEHHCHMITLAVFPGNERARKMYEAAGFDVDLVRMAMPLS